MSQLVWLALGAFAIGTEGFMIAGILPAISTDLGTTVERSGHLVTAFAAAYAISSPILSSLLAEVARKRLLLAALAVFAVGNLAAAATSSLPVLMAARIAIGISAGVFMPTANAVAISLVGPERRGRAIAVVTGGLTLATALGVPLGTLVAALGNWRLAFVMVGGLAVLGIIGLAFGLPRELPLGSSTLAERLAVARQPRVLLALASTLMWITGAMTIYTYIAPFLAAHAGITGAVLSVALVIFGVGAAIGNGIGGRISDRFGPMRTVGLAVAGLLAIFLVTSIIALTVPAGPVAAAIFFVLIALWGAIGWGGYPAQSARLVGLAPQAAMVTLSLNASALYLGIALGAALGSLVISYGSLPMLGVAAALCEATALAFIVLAMRMARNDHQPAADDRAAPPAPAAPRRAA
ncbi:MFS transporter [Phreatobacter stygius]|uniref:MFS transporter n=1 Tax=Phreatobacter stygius TaxID=1940610 RepID=A0A4D7B2D7_9HYPH|nr:MFS transporter [Phreatobacter stygius]QCI65475.1 MFS transporter [Phreatobacter stygius]